MTAEPKVCYCCGEVLPDNHLAWNFSLPDPVAELSQADQARRIGVATEAVVTCAGLGSFFRVILPISMDTGRTATVGIWIAVDETDFDRIMGAAHGNGESWESLSFGGMVANRVQPWPKIYRAQATAAVPGDPPDDGSLAVPRLVASEHALLGRLLTEAWPEAEFLGARPSHRKKSLLQRVFGS